MCESLKEQTSSWTARLHLPALCQSVRPPDRLIQAARGAHGSGGVAVAAVSLHALALGVQARVHQAVGPSGARGPRAGQQAGGGALAPGVPRRHHGELIGSRACAVIQDTATEEQPTETLPSQKREDRLRKFRELHFKRNEARKLNHQEVVEEDKRLKLPSNWEAKKARLEWELAKDQEKKECAARGEDYDRVKLLEITADDAERWERKKKKKNPDTGFAGYAEAQFRQYQRLTKQIRPDLEGYERQREDCGEDFHPTSNSLIHGTHVPTKEGIDRMVEDVEKQIEKRAKYSRRRAYNDDADIDYINERNAKFNKKAERFYGKYTAEIKQNLERGTAV